MGELLTPTHMMVAGIIPVILILVPFWQIFKKAGMPAPLALLMVIPVINIVMLYLLAFSKWKTAPNFSRP